MLQSTLMTALLQAAACGGVSVVSDLDPHELTRLERLCARGLVEFAEAEGPWGGRLYAYRLTEDGRRATASDLAPRTPEGD